MKKVNHTDIYITSIVEDIQTRFVNEETIKHSDNKIKRNYEFEDGAVVTYEWQSGLKGDWKESYNHRFTLVKNPKPNPNKLKEGVIRVIYHSSEKS